MQLLNRSKMPTALQQRSIIPMLLVAPRQTLTNLEMLWRPMPSFQLFNRELTTIFFVERIQMHSHRWASVNSRRLIAQLKEMLLVMFLRHPLPSTAMLNSALPSSKSNASNTMWTISVFTEVVYPRRAEVQSEELLWVDLANSINLRFITSTISITPIARQWPLRTPSSSRPTCRVTKIHSRCHSPLTSLTMTVTLSSWRIAHSGSPWPSVSSASCTLRTSMSARRQEWCAGSVCKTSKTCLLITSTTVAVSSWRSNSPVSRSTTRTSTKWWPGTAKLTQVKHEKYQTTLQNNASLFNSLLYM